MRGRGELHPVSGGERPLLLPINGDTLLAAWIVALLRAVLQLHGQPVAGSVDALHPRVFAFSDAGFLRAAAVAQHIAHVVPFGPGAVRSGEILTRHKYLGAMLFLADHALRLQFSVDRLVNLRAGTVVG